MRISFLNILLGVRLVNLLQALLAYISLRFIHSLRFTFLKSKGYLETLSISSFVLLYMQYFYHHKPASLKPSRLAGLYVS